MKYKDNGFTFGLPFKFNLIYQSKNLYNYPGLYLKVSTYDKQKLLQSTKKYRLIAL